MREIVIISGKGGTGKTSLTAAFAHLAENKVLCDLDVDAPDLHILLDPEVESETEFVSGFEARIDQERCVGCGQCAEVCRFDAVERQGDAFMIAPVRCEGCKVCVALCPEKAVDFIPKHCGDWYVSSTRVGPMVHAQLFPGEENSGRLVTLLKRKARDLGESQGLELILCDGAPGIGCPVISSLSGTDLAVVVTEPTPSGIHDMRRVTELCDHFRVPVAVIVNKHDLNAERSVEIDTYAATKGYDVVAHLPHDPVITEAMVERKAVTEIGVNAFSEKLSQAWARVCALVDAHEAKAEKITENQTI